MDMDDTAATAPDDRWSAFLDPNRVSALGIKKVEAQGPDLTEYIENVLEQRTPKKTQERKYKTATGLVRLVTGMAYALTTEWKQFLQVNKRNEIRTTNLRTLTENNYECMVPLMRPLKPNSFKLIHSSLDVMPTHRYLIKLDPGLSKEEALLVRREWEPHIDKQGFLRPLGLLEWFNAGLEKACSILVAESSRVTNARCKTLQDGTMTIHIGICTDEENPAGDIEVLTINIFPVFLLNSLPSNISIRSPLPHTGHFTNMSKSLRQLIVHDLEHGRQVVFLEPRLEIVQSAVKNNFSPGGPSWALNLSFTEHHVYQVMDQHCQTDYRKVLVLMTIIRDVYPEELRKLNNEILVHTLFKESHKQFTKLNALHEWFLALMESLIAALSSGKLRSFYLQRQNLFEIYHISESERQVAINRLRHILQSVNGNPKELYKFTGYVEKKKNKGDSGDNETESDPGEDDPREDEPGEDDPEKDDPGEDDPEKDNYEKGDLGEDDPAKDDPGEDDPEKDDPKENDSGNNEMRTGNLEAEMDSNLT